MTRSQLHAAQDKRILEFIGVDYPYKRPKSQWVKSDPDKILALADPHNPYASMKVCKAVERDHKNAGMVVVPGDVGDYYSKSRFRKNRAVPFNQEVRSVFLYLEWLATHWKDVRIQLGNHDNRPEKAVMDIMGKDIDLMILTEQNLILNLASFFDNIQIVGTQISGDAMDDGRRHKVNLTHIYQVGDIVFTHGEKSMAQASSLMMGISQYLHRWKSILGLKPYRIIAQAHNHNDFRMTMGDEKWIQLPAACEPVSIGMEYIFSTRMMGTPPATGYAIFYQSDGVTDYNASGNVLL